MAASRERQSASSDNAAKAAYEDLVAKKRLLVRKSAVRQVQLKAIDDAMHALHPSVHGKFIGLELTSDEASLLMSVAVRYATGVHETHRQLSQRVLGLTRRIYNAMCEQDADYARRVQAYYANAGRNQGQEAGPTRLKPRKKDCPYPKYTDEQMQKACYESDLGLCNGYTRINYARLYLSRDALVEMYRRPRCVKLVYAYILKAIDDHGGDNCGSVFPVRDYQPIRPSAVSGARPYDRHTEAEMRQGLKELCLTPRKVASAYGCLAVSLNREAVLRLYRSKPGHPGVACLI